MVELGETADPVELVPGAVWSVRDVAVGWRAWAVVADEVAAAVARISVEGEWSGAAADAFVERVGVVPGRWRVAAGEFVTAANAVDRYADTVEWAQYQAGEAVTLWDAAAVASAGARVDYERAVFSARAEFDAVFVAQGVRPLGSPPLLAFVDPGERMRVQARGLLADARWRVGIVGEEAAAVVTAAAGVAPDGPDEWAIAGAAIEAVWEQYSRTAVNGGIDVVNAVASVGNAALNNPGAVLAVLGGAGLVVLGAGGEVGGVALDATGVGAVGGIPLNIVSAGAITGGLALAGAGAAGLITEAAGASKTELLYRESSGIDRGDRRDETGQFTTKNGGARGDAYVKEQEGLDEMATEFNSEVIRTQVRAEVEGAKSHRYFDGLMEKADGSFMGIEVKSGSGVPSPNQKNFDPLVSETNPATAKLNGKIIQITETYLKEVP